LKRAGLDYWPMVGLVVHMVWETAGSHLAQGSQRPLGERLHLFSSRGGATLFETEFHEDDVLIFGSEGSGLPRELLDAYPNRRCYIPIQSGVRSLNLANVVCLGLYTALDRAGVALPANDGQYEAHANAGDKVQPADRARRVEGN